MERSAYFSNLPPYLQEKYLGRDYGIKVSVKNETSNQYSEIARWQYRRLPLSIRRTYGIHEAAMKGFLSSCPKIIKKYPVYVPSPREYGKQFVFYIDPYHKKWYERLCADVAKALNVSYVDIFVKHSSPMMIGSEISGGSPSSLSESSMASRKSLKEYGLEKIIAERLDSSDLQVKIKSERAPRSPESLVDVNSEISGSLNASESSDSINNLKLKVFSELVESKIAERLADAVWGSDDDDHEHFASISSNISKSGQDVVPASLIEAHKRVDAFSKDHTKVFPHVLSAFSDKENYEPGDDLNSYMSRIGAVYPGCLLNKVSHGISNALMKAKCSLSCGPKHRKLYRSASRSGSVHCLPAVYSCKRRSLAKKKCPPKMESIVVPYRCKDLRNKSCFKRYIHRAVSSSCIYNWLLDMKRRFMLYVRSKSNLYGKCNAKVDCCRDDMAFEPDLKPKCNLSYEKCKVFNKKKDCIIHFPSLCSPLKTKKRYCPHGKYWWFYENCARGKKYSQLEKSVERSVQCNKNEKKTSKWKHSSSSSSGSSSSGSSSSGSSSSSSGSDSGYSSGSGSDGDDGSKNSSVLYQLHHQRSTAVKKEHTVIRHHNSSSMSVPRDFLINEKISSSVNASSSPSSIGASIFDPFNGNVISNKNLYERLVTRKNLTRQELRNISELLVLYPYVTFYKRYLEVAKEHNNGTVDFCIPIEYKDKVKKITDHIYCCPCESSVWLIVGCSRTRKIDHALDELEKNPFEVLDEALECAWGEPMKEKKLEKSKCLEIKGECGDMLRNLESLRQRECRSTAWESEYMRDMESKHMIGTDKEGLGDYPVHSSMTCEKDKPYGPLGIGEVPNGPKQGKRVYDACKPDLAEYDWDKLAKFRRLWKKSLGDGTTKHSAQFRSMFKAGEEWLLLAPMDKVIGSHISSSMSDAQAVDFIKSHMIKPPINPKSVGVRQSLCGSKVYYIGAGLKSIGRSKVGKTYTGTQSLSGKDVKITILPLESEHYQEKSFLHRV